jgi:molecular chaperone GrpE
MSNEPTDMADSTLSAAPVDANGVQAAITEPADGLDSGLSSNDLAKLREKAAQTDEYKDRYLRAVADFENFRKRAARERQEAVQYANQALLEKLAPVLDSLEMALAAVTTGSPDAIDSLKKGVELVLGQLKNVLGEAGLVEIDALGQPFDPTWHEAVSQQETLEVPEGYVVQQLRKGYRLHQRLLRPATVVVARPPGT